MENAMTELEFLSQYVRWSLGLGGLAISAAFGLLWFEIRGLRKVRHEDRDIIQRVSLDNEMLTNKVREQMMDLKEENEELKHENKMLKYMLKTGAKGSDLEYVKS